METEGRKRGRGPLERLYRLIMRRNSVYVTFVIVGAFLGERAVDYGVRKLWEKNNIGKRYEDIPVLGQRQPEE
ncbi:cytochrome b-c1 complex subunit 9, mitochondrial-like isoform X2 [Nicotiana tomentosiformis]|uniref:Complex III subunit 9 n=1 Tax=Nicotiana tabacum TaxID=4097 RepID=A0A1S4APJ1_TOBAC|nr:cytochrome b-c1 complex subunit 9-like [Nicotiana tomentosiformis]XP_016478450.1 PREDICTED: cytochrome b-c1 complex subunit 9-like isoform X2 [Nicotiana tabacum]